MIEVAASRWRMVAVGFAGVVALVLTGSFVNDRWLSWGPDACDVLSGDELASVAGAPIAGGGPFEPEGGESRSTGCSVGGGEPGTYAIVFAVRRNAAAMYERGLAAEEGRVLFPLDVGGRGYRAHVWGEHLFLLRQGTYVNVNLYNAPPGSAAALAPVVASHID